MTKYTRTEVAEQLSVTPTTIYRWEKAKKSPVVPRRVRRTRELIYTKEDVDILRDWMDELEEPEGEKNRGGEE